MGWNPRATFFLPDSFFSASPSPPYQPTKIIPPAVAALSAVGLTLFNPAQFGEADRYGGFLVGLIVVLAGARVSRDTAIQLMDTMPDDEMMRQVRSAAGAVPGVRGVEKCFARKTG